MQTLRNVILISAITCLIGFLAGVFVVGKSFSIPFKQAPKERILDKYSIENLAKADIKPGKLILNREENTFSFDFEPALDGKAASTSGQIRIPGKGKYPVVVLIRGYVDREIYKTGVGTEHGSEVFAKNGYITIAPDFLGYGNSSPESTNLFESRFQTYTTILTLLKSLNQIGEWDGTNIFIWAHSNGGQIALTTLEITGAKYPTALWAPVSTPFPYSILYFTDELSDYGKYLRSELAKFEADYDVNLYSAHNYYKRIRAPIDLHQGEADESVPVKWSDALNKSLEENSAEVDYHKYPGTDHNMIPSWNTAIAHDLEFFKKNTQ